MKLLFRILFSFSTLSSFGQVKIDVTKNDADPISGNVLQVVGGEPFIKATYARVVEGSAFFSEKWMKGSVVMVDGAVYGGILLKLDLVNNEVHYLTRSGEEMIAGKPIQKIILEDTLAKRNFTFIHTSFISNNASLPKGWCQVLLAGEIIFMKYTLKQLNENKPYGSATIEQTITSASHYFLVNKNAVTGIKKIKNIPDILADKKQQLLQYIDDNKLKGKSDDDYQKLLQYYESIRLQRTSFNISRKDFLLKIMQYG